jgi:predicted nucleic acid-binding Zn ribbon protein
VCGVAKFGRMVHRLNQVIVRGFMPEYLYTCACGYSESIRHGMSEDVMVECSNCMVPMIRKPQIGAVQFRGEGWASKEGKK